MSFSIFQMPTFALRQDTFVSPDHYKSNQWQTAIYRRHLPSSHRESTPSPSDDSHHHYPPSPYQKNPLQALSYTTHIHHFTYASLLYTSTKSTLKNLPWKSNLLWCFTVTFNHFLYRGGLNISAHMTALLPTTTTYLLTPGCIVLLIVVYTTSHQITSHVTDMTYDCLKLSYKAFHNETQMQPDIQCNT